MDGQLTLRYSGPAVDAGRMDAYEAAGNIVGFADYFGVATRALYGPQAKLSTEVRAFRSGSFAIEFAVHLGAIATLLSATNARELVELAKAALELWKFLKGREPAQIIRGDGDTVAIKNVQGDVTVVHVNTLNVVANPDAAKAAARFVRAPLSKGVNTVALEYEGRVIEEIDQASGSYIGALVPLEMLTENMVRVWLTLESPDFRKDNKWELSDGQQTFYAAIDDETFLARIERHEVLFGKDDALLVDLLIRQSGTPGAIKTERRIVRVHDLRHAPTQGRL